MSLIIWIRTRDPMAWQFPGCKKLYSVVLQWKMLRAPTRVYLSPSVPLTNLTNPITNANIWFDLFRALSYACPTKSEVI